MTLLQVYSVLTGTNSTPMEFVNQVADHYIRQWASEVGFFDDGHLPYLYNRTAEFFALQSVGNGDGTAAPNDAPAGSPNDSATGSPDSSASASFFVAAPFVLASLLIPLAFAAFQSPKLSCVTDIWFKKGSCA